MTTKRGRSKSKTTKTGGSKPKTTKKARSKSMTTKRGMSQSKTTKRAASNTRPKKASSSSSDSDSSGPWITVPLKKRSVSKRAEKKVPQDQKVVLKEDIHKLKSKTEVARDVEAILVIEKDSKDSNKLDIDYDVVVDPDTKQPMNVRTHAEVDKDKMDVTGVAEAEGAGTADVEGIISKGGAKDQDDFTLDVTNKPKDKKKINLRAKKQEEMDKK